MTPQGDTVWTLLNPMVGLRLAWKYLRRPRVDPLELPAQNKSVSTHDEKGLCLKPR